LAGNVASKFLTRNGFLTVMMVLYGSLALYNFDLFISCIERFGDLLIKIFPVLCLVFVIMFLLDLFLRPGTAKKMLGKESGLKGWIFAMVGGILSAGPIYMWYPLLEDLKAKGMRDSLMAAFLYARSIKIPLLPIMVYYFGWAFTVTLCFYLVIFSVLSGLAVERLNQVGRGP